MENEQTKPETIDAYIAQFSHEMQQILQAVRQTIREAAPKATEKISWGMPTFYLEGNLVHFAVQKHHLGFYPSPTGIDAFKDVLEPYHSSKGAVQFPFSSPIPHEIIRQITLYRVQENLQWALEKKEAKKSKT